MADQLANRPAHVPPERVVMFDVYAPPGVDEDFHQAWHQLHAPGVPDLVWTPYNEGHWIVTRNRLLEEVFVDHERFSSRVMLVPKSMGEQAKLLPTAIDPPAHRAYRLLLNSSVSPKAVKGMEDRMRELACGLIEEIAPLGACNFSTDYAEIFPVRVFMQLCGLPLEDSEMLKGWADQAARPDGSMTMEEIVGSFYDYFGPHIEARQGRDGTDLIGRIVNGQIGDRPINMKETLELVTQVLIGGLDTVVNFLGFVMLFLARNPNERRLLTADPSLIPLAMEEMIRRFPIATIAREIVYDMEYEGVVLKRGEMITCATPLGGLDDTVHKNPMKMDFNRSEREHVTFGAGPHRCPGAHLARREIQITLEEWLKRIPEFEVAPDREIRFGGGIVGVVQALPLIWKAAG